MSTPPHTPFDDAIEHMKRVGFHNQRTGDHSNVVSDGILQDLIRRCGAVREDFANGVVGHWKNRRTPGARGRKIDLLVAEPLAGGKKPDLKGMRLCIENKSVATAHRNADARFDDLNESLQVLHQVQPDAIFIATVLIGTAERFLNIADNKRQLFDGRGDEFERNVLPRLSSGDQRLWEDLRIAVSPNEPSDSAKTVRKFRMLPVREPGRTHVVGYDFVLLVPVFIDNVNPPRVERQNQLGIDIDREYQRMLDRICRAYETRWRLT